MDKKKRVKQSVVLNADQLELMKCLAVDMDTSISSVIRKAIDAGVVELGKKRQWWKK